MLRAKVLIGLLWAALAALGLETPNKELQDASNDVIKEGLKKILAQMFEDNKITMEDILGNGTQSEIVVHENPTDKKAQNKGVQDAGNNKTLNEDPDDEASKKESWEQLDQQVRNMTTDMMVDLVSEMKKGTEKKSIINRFNESEAYRANDDTTRWTQGNGTSLDIKELYFNRPLNYEQYHARNWMWLRCRTFTSNVFDVGGSWIADDGKEWLREARKTRCGVLNWEVRYVNGQGWGDAYIAWDWFAIGCDMVKAVRAAVRAARKAATQTRRELYIYNCLGFDDYPWSFIEMRRGVKEPMNANGGMGVDPAVTQQEKWFKGEDVIAFDPISPDGVSKKASMEAQSKAANAAKDNA